MSNLSPEYLDAVHDARTLARGRGRMHYVTRWKRGPYTVVCCDDFEPNGSRVIIWVAFPPRRKAQNV
jgi:hypothetical protein